MSNRTFVCFECRTTERVSAGRITKYCRKCRQQTERVHYEFKIPGRDDGTAWNALKRHVRAFNRQQKSVALARLREERMWLERLLAGAPAGKPDRLRLLRIRLKALNERFDQWTQVIDRPE